MSKRPSKSFEVSRLFESRTACLNDVRAVLSGLCNDGCLTRREARRCALALVEAVTNAIVHAHRREPAKKIGVRIMGGRKDIVLEVRDEGEGFDVNGVPPPRLFGTGGRGIFIIKRLMKRVEYKGNTLRMTYERREKAS
jgi:anti-sigma regulatory factor (Ser/Thr protein kinase)